MAHCDPRPQGCSGVLPTWGLCCSHLKCKCSLTSCFLGTIFGPEMVLAKEMPGSEWLPLRWAESAWLWSPQPGLHWAISPVPTVVAGIRAVVPWLHGPVTAPKVDLLSRWGPTLLKSVSSSAKGLILPPRGPPRGWGCSPFLRGSWQAHSWARRHPLFRLWPPAGTPPAPSRRLRLPPGLGSAHQACQTLAWSFACELLCCPAPSLRLEAGPGGRVPAPRPSPLLPTLDVPLGLYEAEMGRWGPFSPVLSLYPADRPGDRAVPSRKASQGSSCMEGEMQTLGAPRRPGRPGTLRGLWSLGALESTSLHLPC